MSAKTMHLEAGKIANIKYVTIIFSCHIPIFSVQGKNTEKFTHCYYLGLSKI